MFWQLVALAVDQHLWQTAGGWRVSLFCLLADQIFRFCPSLVTCQLIGDGF
jgi:hypothetical protein